MRIENTITVVTPMSTAWSVTKNVEAWPLWTPTMEKVKKMSIADLSIGSEVLIKQPQMPEAKWTVIELEEESIFSWCSKVKGMNITATHTLIELEESVENKLTIEVSGILAMLLWPLLRGKFNQALIQENLGFKEYCEKNQK